LLRNLERDRALALGQREEIVVLVTRDLYLDKFAHGKLARDIDATVDVGSIGLAAELFAWSERNSEKTLARAYRQPGHQIQRYVATKEPTDEQIEVGEAAMLEILRAEGAEV